MRPGCWRRHASGSFLYAKYGGQRTAGWLGHSETILFRHYRELVSKGEANAFFSITPDSAAQLSRKLAARDKERPAA